MAGRPRIYESDCPRIRGILAKRAYRARKQALKLEGRRQALIEYHEKALKRLKSE